MLGPPVQHSWQQLCSERQIIAFLKDLKACLAFGCSKWIAKYKQKANSLVQVTQVLPDCLENLVELESKRTGGTEWLTALLVRQGAEQGDLSAQRSVSRLDWREAVLFRHWALGTRKAAIPPLKRLGMTWSCWSGKVYVFLLGVPNSSRHVMSNVGMQTERLSNHDTTVLVQASLKNPLPESTSRIFARPLHAPILYNFGIPSVSTAVFVSRVLLQQRPRSKWNSAVINLEAR